nr:hypothetical protein [uncultured Campylobacter sp.]
MNRRHGIILRTMDFADRGFTSRGFAFARRVLILSCDAVLRAVLRRIADYFRIACVPICLYAAPYGFTINSVAPAKHIAL